MAIQIIETYLVEWTVSGGEINPVFLPPEENLNHLGQVEPPVEFIWTDATARLIEGPEPLVGHAINGRAALDTRTIVTDDLTGEIVSDTVARTYPPCTMSSMTIGSQYDEADWVDLTNPAKPKQRGGPVLWQLEPEEPIDHAGAATVGIDNNQEVVLGFVDTRAALPNSQLEGENSFYICLEDGEGYGWADGGPGGGGFQWAKLGVSKNPGEINRTPYASTNDLPIGGEGVPNGNWAVVNNNGASTVYQRTPRGWLNIGPVQPPGGGTIIGIPPDDRKRYVSGYIYPLIFNRCNFKYVPRMSGGTQDTYRGEIDIIQTGWFPQLPYDEDNNIYPMDSVTKFKPDDREMIPVVYTATLSTSIVAGSCTIIQDVYQPTYNWGQLLRELLATCYFTNGIYH